MTDPLPIFSETNIIGVDPGPATGIVTLHWAPGVITWPPEIRAYQCSAGTAPKLLKLLLEQEVWTAGQIEHFVHGNLPNSPTTVALENELADIAENWGLRLARRPMATVKPWASEKRLAAAGLIRAVPAKMVDARAAGRHAVYCAVNGAHLPDPLSKGARAA
jgi:hypothetical protein